MNPQSTRCNRRSRAQSIIETVVGIMFLVPIVLFLFDIAVLVLANTANDNLVKTACRAAASATDTSKTPIIGTSDTAFKAAKAACKNFQTSVIIKPTGGTDDSEQFLTGFYFNSNGDKGSAGGQWPGPLPQGQAAPEPAAGQVACITTMHITIPVPFPFLPTTFDFAAKDVEPIVSVAP